MQRKISCNSTNNINDEDEDQNQQQATAAVETDDKLSSLPKFRPRNYLVSLVLLSHYNYGVIRYQIIDWKVWPFSWVFTRWQQKLLLEELLSPGAHVCWLVVPMYQPLYQYNYSLYEQICVMDTYLLLSVWVRYHVAHVPNMSVISTNTNIVVLYCPASKYTQLSQMKSIHSNDNDN